MDDGKPKPNVMEHYKEREEADIGWKWRKNSASRRFQKQK